MAPAYLPDPVDLLLFRFKHQYILAAVSIQASVCIGGASTEPPCLECASAQTRRQTMGLCACWRFPKLWALRRNRLMIAVQEDEEEFTGGLQLVFFHRWAGTAATVSASCIAATQNVAQA
jgi:hypothetical protein